MVFLVRLARSGDVSYSHCSGVGAKGSNDHVVVGAALDVGNFCVKKGENHLWCGDDIVFDELILV